MWGLRRPCQGAWVPWFWVKLWILLTRRFWILLRRCCPVGIPDRRLGTGVVPGQQPGEQICDGQSGLWSPVGRGSGENEAFDTAYRVVRPKGRLPCHGPVPGGGTHGLHSSAAPWGSSPRGQFSIGGGVALSPCRGVSRNKFWSFALACCVAGRPRVVVPFCWRYTTPYTSLLGRYCAVAGLLWTCCGQRAGE